MFKLSLCLLFLVFAVGLCFNYKPYTVSIVSFNQSNETGVFDTTTLRLIGRERLVNGTVELKEDMDDSHWSFAGELYFNPTENNNFKRMAFNIPLTPICKAFKNYRKYFSKHAEYGKQTNFPMHMDVCPVPKGTYYLKNIHLNSDNFPLMLQRGYMLGQGLFYYDGVHVGTYSICTILEDVD
ncbi:uncharacterized protein LOC108044248 [Drosophila rhopaloa]|uniref:Uncharacterized protein LOC108044248 n=1 Tax=Drosophila rhopaloa TaxID=1041015 RepID=A0A6P4EKD5_DRORH|nr:uncharacterized protein LOC108044248 [Drosophila rhopaloa]